MRRIGVIGALVLILAMFGSPAFAQVDPAGGSVLPPPGQAQSQPLPPAGSGSATPRTVSQATSSPALADTGIQVSTGVAVGFALLVAGGGALVLTRRRTAA